MGGITMELVLNQRQEQSLTMTFQLRQAIELLQYSTYDLYQYIKEKELENPLIELEEHNKDFSFEGKSTRKVASASSTQQLIDFVRSREICMREKLFSEVKLLFHHKEDQQLLHYIIFNLDDCGYFRITDHNPFDAESIERGIHLLQQIGPVGIGARNLQECLLLQIIYDFPEEKLVKILIENHLNLLANRKWNELARYMKISLEEVKETYEFIQTLNPKPFFGISDESVEYLNPDIIVEYKEGNLSYYLNDGYLPEIHFNNEYAGLLQEKDETSKYINNQYSQYKWLLSSIEQRRSTILKIVKVLLEKQKMFFTEGFGALKPLTLKEVAEEIEMHESTISRATMHKVIQTPRGSFELK